MRVGNAIIPLVVEVDGNGIVGEARIKVGTRVLGYVSGSKYEDSMEVEALDVVADVLEPLFRAHPSVSDISSLDARPT